MDYKPNSHRSKEEGRTERKKMDKVVSGGVKTRKKSELSKLADAFIAEDTHSVGSYIFADILIPAIKNTIVDVIFGSVNMLFFGSTSRKSGSGPSHHVSYNKMSSSRGYSEVRARTGYNHDDIVLDSRGEAEDVLERMREAIDEYGTVSVGDLYDLVGKTNYEYTDNKYGWTNLRNAEPIRVRDGYMLKLPKALPLD